MPNLKSESNLAQSQGHKLDPSLRFSWMELRTEKTSPIMLMPLFLRWAFKICHFSFCKFASFCETNNVLKNAFHFGLFAISFTKAYFLSTKLDKNIANKIAKHVFWQNFSNWIPGCWNNSFSFELFVIFAGIESWDSI